MSVRLGMIARASNRGLGIQTYAFYEQMQPDRTLVIDMGHDRDPLGLHLDRFPNAWDVVAPEQLDRAESEAFLDGLDVVYSAETFYSDTFLEVAQERGVRTVMHANWEFLGHARYSHLPRPDLFLAPSAWRYDDWPMPKRLLPFPVDRERFRYRQRDHAGTFLHVAGWPTAADRNGTWSFLQSLRHVHTPIRVVVTSQHELPTSLVDRRNIPACVDLEVRVGDIDDHLALYDEGDVLVLPRRFGGLSLVLNEAASLGLAILALDREPENFWIPREGLVPAYVNGYFDAQSGPVAIATPHDEDLAARMQRLVAEPETVALLSKASDAYADSISWERSIGQFRDLFAELCA